MTPPLLARLALLCSLLSPGLRAAADEVIFKDKAGRVLTASDLAQASGSFTWEIVSSTPVSDAARKEHALGRAAGQRGEHRAALAHFAAASKMAPAWPYPFYDTAFTYLLQKDFDQAYTYYRRVDQMAPRGFFTVKTAVHSLQMEREGALPQGTYLHYLSLEWEADKQKARQMAHAMARMHPGFAPAWKTAASLENDLGKRAQLLEAGLKARPDAETRGFLLLNKAQVLHEQNKTPQAQAILGALALDPGSPRDIEALAKRSLALMVLR